MSSLTSRTGSAARVAFGDVVRLSRERSSDPMGDGFGRYVGLEHIEPGDLKVRRWGDVADGTTFTSVFRKGQVLFGKRRAYQRKVAAADFDGVCSGDIYVLESRNKHLLPDLLPFICQTDGFFEHAVGTSAGSLSPRTNWKSLATYSFELPPIEEQQRAAEVLWLCEAAQESARLLEWRCGSLMQSMLAEVCRTSGRSLRVADVCPFITSGSRGWARYYSSSGSVFFRISNMTRGCVRPDWSDTKFVNAPNDAEAERTKVAINDVLVSVTAELGLVTLVDGDFPETHVNQHIAILRPDQSLVSPRFLAYYLASDSGMRQFQRLNDQGAKAGLNLVSVGDLELPGLPLAEQDRLADILQRVARGEAAATVRREELVKLRRSLLRSILGEVPSVLSRG